MDCQRAIRVIRYYAKQEEWGGQDMIAACGWSGGGATILGSIRKCFGYNTPTVYDSDYVPDEIDAVSSDLDAALIIYGAYNADGEGTYVGDNPNLPAFYINHGTGDDTIPYTNAQELYDLVSTRVPAKLTFVEGAPHGYGVGSEEFPDSSTWPTEADEFMQANLGQSQLYTVEEMSFYRDELEIYGQLIMPKGDGPFPLVIFAHGFGGNHTNSLSMAKRFAEAGVAAYTFDFCGGGRKSLSDGDTKDMSVLTEASDMNAVLDGLVVMPQIDASNIFAFGYSQGGFVSSYLAATRPGDIKALVAFFPAYVIHDDAKKNITDPENIPDEMQLMGMTIGHVYYEDALSFDIYDLLPNYTGDVLLLHGTKDPIVPIEYSERAVELFPSAELVIVEGGAHGNLGTDADDRAFSFVLEHID
jgi:dienelactone hydrolase